MTASPIGTLHTPGLMVPRRLNGRAVVTIEDDVIARVFCTRAMDLRSIAEAYGEAKANAGRIALCWNAHDALVAMVREALQQWNTQFEGEQDGDPWCVAARALLAKVSAGAWPAGSSGGAA